MSSIEEYAEEKIFVWSGAKPSKSNVTHFINACLWEHGIGASFMKEFLVLIQVIQILQDITPILKDKEFSMKILEN